MTNRPWVKRLSAVIIAAAVIVATLPQTIAENQPLDLKAAFSYFEKIKKDDVSLLVKDLKSGRQYTINPEPVNKDGDAALMAASVIKLHLAYHIVHEIDAKKVSWDKTYKDPVSGRKFTIRDEMKKMITVSNNGSFNTLLRFMKPADINKGFESYNMLHTKVYAELGPAGDGWSTANNVKRYGTTKGGRINAAETAIMLEDIAARRTEANMKVLHQFMTQVTNKDRIPSGVGKEIIVAHKTGSMINDGVFDDAGIVYGKHGTYIFCILVQHQKSTIDKETRNAVKKAFETLEKMNSGH